MAPVTSKVEHVHGKLQWAFDTDLSLVSEIAMGLTGEIRDHFYRCGYDAERGHGLECLDRLPLRTGLVGPATVGASVCSEAGS